jgi:hypothetical protein
MAKTGRPAGGEYPDKREVANFRIRPDTKRLLEAAARKSGRTISQETEHQLRRALIDKGGPTHAVASAVSAALDKLLTGTPVAESWLKDAGDFDRVAGAFAATLAMFRPSGTVVEIEGEIARYNTSARKALVTLMAQAADADRSLPLGKQAYYERVLGLLGHDLGEIIARPAIHELHSAGPTMKCPHCNQPLHKVGESR